MQRSHFNGTLSLAELGQTVTLKGWVAKYRNLGSLLFIDLRDSSGIVQLTIDHPENFPDVRNEYVIEVEGKVAKKDVPNPRLKTGEIEILVSKMNVINKAELTPFIIADQSDALEDTRLQYRYLDLRRPCLLHNLRIRAQICSIFRSYFDAHHFLEVETPILNLSSPEGARDYLVPSRVHPGSFYALPQSPQLWKQLLMVGGVERYYQVAKCFRDEDLRADRQPEFTQLDLECSFLSQDEILTLMEGFLKRLFKEIRGVDIVTPLRRIKYWDALDTYGSDKPDTRYDLKIRDVTALLKKSSFPGFGEADMVKGIVVPGVAAQTSRKVLDELTLEAKKWRLKAYYCLKCEGGALTGPFAKFVDEALAKELIAELSLQEGDVFFFSSSDNRRIIDFGMGGLRTYYAKKLNLVPENTFDLLWVIDFPMFTPVEGENRVVAEHHPFTRPRDEDLPLLDTKPEEVLAYAYDIVINGYEAGGGTLRIYDHDIQWKIFRMLGLSEEEVAQKFGWFVDAFRYGTPPHGGLAFGLDRLAMILAGTENIRDVTAFPKNLQASDPTSKAPQPVDPKQLEDLFIEVKSE
ncbi:MAG: aspartate--tRNA ligase [Bacilli bacterium]|nr:aspartate--tRNA ligase [Bacilli bacterium]